ncbi:1-aminocyclopropane-1-carboxylate deaminase/D-cysteine desulfhydrase [Pseudomonas sp. N040]|uniref:1-aminocyclopropane-1-carboxylate deaminase/D-cysteine desulfhydrase n=1 Tax=Pseudomonas sp. N040 TaxID=2785325 RepID=UPI00280A5A27|nr:pyridoxal-phosphate dependent enzyme [Pseudomonas sp. N040]
MGAALAPLQPLAFEWSEQAGIRLAVLRLDLLDPLLGGNKWFKLQGHLQAAQAAGARGLLSLGGAHSNHLHALAAAGQRGGFATVGLLRGEPQATPTVADLQAFGMHLHWLGYGGYRARHQPGFARQWQQRYPGFYLVPEGGGGLPGAAGFAAIPALLRQQLAQLGWSDYDGCWLAAGTGTSLAGLVIAEAGAHLLYGARVVPAGHGVETQVSQLLQQAGVADQGYRLVDASRGGYARIDRPLAQFIAEIDADGQLPVEACYTGKALLALRARVRDGYFASGTRLVFLHTGGMQGRRAQQQTLRALL